MLLKGISLERRYLFIFMESRLNHVSNALTKHKWNYENAVDQYEKYKQKKRVGITWSGILRATFDTQMAPTL